MVVVEMKQVNISHTISPPLKHNLPFSKKLMKETTKEKSPGNFQPEEKKRTLPDSGEQQFVRVTTQHQAPLDPARRAVPDAI